MDLEFYIARGWKLVTIKLPQEYGFKLSINSMLSNKRYLIKPVLTTIWNYEINPLIFLI